MAIKIYEGEESVKLTFEKEKETKGTVRYKEEGDNPQVGTLYLKKSAVEKLEDPDKVVIEVKAA